MWGPLPLHRPQGTWGTRSLHIRVGIVTCGDRYRCTVLKARGEHDRYTSGWGSLHVGTVTVAPSSRHVGNTIVTHQGGDRYMWGPLPLHRPQGTWGTRSLHIRVGIVTCGDRY